MIISRGSDLIELPHARVINDNPSKDAVEIETGDTILRKNHVTGEIQEYTVKKWVPRSVCDIEGDMIEIEEWWALKEGLI